MPCAVTAATYTKLYMNTLRGTNDTEGMSAAACVSPEGMQRVSAPHGC